MIGTTAIDEHLKKAEKLSDMVAWYESHDSVVRKFILDLIRIKQLRQEGIDQNENVIGLYSQLTELLSGGRKKAGTHFTLYDTGEFYRSMFVLVMKDSIIIDANYSKMTDQDWWSIDILGP